MINFTFYRNKSGTLTGFKAINHGEAIVCAAVSILTQNTVNSIEVFTDSEFNLEYEPDGGYMEFIINDRIEDKAILLLGSLELGITGIKAEYGNEIEIFVKEV